MTHKGVVPSHEILSALRSRPRPAAICSSCRSVLVVGPQVHYAFLAALHGSYAKVLKVDQILAQLAEVQD